MDAEVVLQEEDMEGSWTLLSWLASFVMVFGGALPYVPQYQEIQRSSNTEGFSTRVCFVLLIANILRIFFWMGKQFEMTLLLQSVVMILTMFAMLHLCCTVQNTNRVSTRQHRLSGNRLGAKTAEPTAIQNNLPLTADTATQRNICQFCAVQIISLNDTQHSTALVQTLQLVLPAKRGSHWRS
uniref:Si:dkey-246g23.2 n=1 Tax=Acanthochromis polyacanthus TaxID=80966 RepID=A0A3Q1GTA3_9TELE